MDDRRSSSVAVRTPPPVSRDTVPDPGPTQLDIALRRRQAEANGVDPQSAVARFGSAW
jgi:hypothetical protein